MKVAPKLIFLLRDTEGFASAISEALGPNPPSSIHTLDEPFELSLERYGIKDQKASGNIIHYLDDKGLYQVSVLLLQNYEPPILACSLNEVLTKIAEENSCSSSIPTLLVPFVVATSKLKWESKSLKKDDSKLSLHSIVIGPETSITHPLVAKTQKLPSSLQIHHEPLACFLHLVRILNLPAFIIVGPTSRSLSDKTAGDELQTLFKVGELLASTLCLSFSRDKLVWNPKGTSKDDKEPWRALYG